MKIKGNRHEAPPKRLADQPQAETGDRRSGRLLPIAYCLLAFVISLSGCGKKSDPRAPELATPETIRDLRGEAAPGGIVLTWTRPLRYVDGNELRDLAGFVIFRKEISGACPDCPVPYRERTTVSVEDQQKFIKTRRFRFVDQELTPQTTYRYRVFSQLLDGSLSEPSNEVELVSRR
jgi:hypothetical protein